MKSLSEYLSLHVIKHCKTINSIEIVYSKHRTLYKKLKHKLNKKITYLRKTWLKEKIIKKPQIMFKNFKFQLSFFLYLNILIFYYLHF